MSSAHLSNVSAQDGDLADRRTAVLVTGAGGEMGHGLIRALADRDPDCAIVGLDLRPAEHSIGALCIETLTGDIRDTEMLEDLASRYRFGHVFHLAAMLSSNAERAPLLAYEVNVGGTMNLLRLAIAERDRTGEMPMVVLPSTIAVYGLSSLAAKTVADTFRTQVLGAKDFGRSPVKFFGGQSFMFIKHTNVYIVAASNISAKDSRANLELGAVSLVAPASTVTENCSTSGSVTPRDPNQSKVFSISRPLDGTPSFTVIGRPPPAAARLHPPRCARG